MSNEENDFMVTVDGSEYKFSELKDENKILVNHIRDIDMQVDQLNFKYEQLTASKTFFSDKLVASLKEAKAEQQNEEVSEVEEVEEVAEVESSSEVASE